MGDRADLFAVADFLSSQVGNNTDIISGGYTPARNVSAVRLTVVLAKTAKFGFTVKLASGAPASGGQDMIYFNSQADLTVNRVYTFTLGVRSKYKYNFRVLTSDVSPGVIHYMAIEEVGSSEL